MKLLDVNVYYNIKFVAFNNMYLCINYYLNLYVNNMMTYKCYISYIDVEDYIIEFY